MNDPREAQAPALRQIVELAVREGIIPENQMGNVCVQTRDEDGVIAVAHGVVGSLNLQAAQA